MMRFRSTAVAFAAVLVTALGLAQAWRGGDTLPGEIGPADPRDPRPPLLEVTLASALQRYDGCAEFTDAVRAAALERVTPWGLGGDQHVEPVSDAVAVRAEAGAPGGGGAAAPAADMAGTDLAAPALSGTNVQERGVDEPDLVKTDGRVLAAVARGALQLVDLSSPTPRLAAHLPLPAGWGHELLLHDGRLLVVTNAHRTAEPPMDPAERRVAADAALVAPGTPQVLLTLYDVRDPSRPRELGSARLDGQAVTSRLVDGTARLVVRSQPRPPLTVPQLSEERRPSDIRRAERAALERNRTILSASRAEDWLPRYEAFAAGGKRLASAPMVPCEQVHHPAEFSGFGMVSVVALPLEAPLSPRGSAGVAADGDIVYATAERLYVAMNRWGTPAGAEVDPVGTVPDRATPSTMRAEIHEFDIRDADQPAYTASGVVPGQLLNQWALSAYDGHLRVATTEGEGAVGPDGAPASESAVRVLRREGPALVEVGKVGGLGKGERIYAVRYLGPVAFVVTFRQTDPLYTLDLADPAAPKVVGELKIPGFSSYLHPVGEGLLLGVGQEADEQTGARLGAQVSLFDVRDLAAPRRIAQVAFEQGSTSEVEHDHRAFLWWPAADRVVLPLAALRWDESSQREAGFIGAVALALDGGLRETGRIRHHGDGDPEPWLGQIRRALVVGDALYTVSERGLLSSGLEDLQRRAWLEFPGTGAKGGPEPVAEPAR